ncbi:MAG: ArsA family ATPase, partial [Actinobacteria bacterium]
MRSLIVSGAGGVGKTTISAALAASAARRGTTALVVTVDPARRLADALGVSLGNDPEPVPGSPGLAAAMLDVTTSWEAIAHRYAEPDVADRLLADPFFRAIADRFPAAQSFAAAERMAELVESGSWELIVVDTPPSGGGIDFFLAPSRIGELVGGKLLTWLTGARIPGRRAFYRLAARPALRLADTVLGGPLLEQVGDFLLDLRTMYDGLSVRANTIGRHLARAETLIVTTADPTPMQEARRFFAALPEVDVTPSAVLFNRALPAEWAGAVRTPLRGVDDAELRAALRDNLRRWGSEARRQED